MSKIISMCGMRNAGKDESADMLVYMLNTPKFMHSYTMYKLFKGIKGKWFKTSFARALKQVLSIILNTSINRFDDREFKERCYINFSTFDIKWDFDLESTDILSDNQFNKCLKNADYQKIMNSYISIRQVMQYIGTNIARAFISNDIWINTTLRNPGHMVISDLRFKREFDVVNEKNGILIYVKRPGCNPGNHASEKEVYELYIQGKFKYIIDNNGTLKDLFNKIKYEIRDVI